MKVSGFGCQDSRIPFSTFLCSTFLPLMVPSRNPQREWNHKINLQQIIDRSIDLTSSQEGGFTMLQIVWIGHRWYFWYFVLLKTKRRSAGRRIWIHFSHGIEKDLSNGGKNYSHLHLVLPLGAAPRAQYLWKISTFVREKQRGECLKRRIWIIFSHWARQYLSNAGKNSFRLHLVPSVETALHTWYLWYLAILF